MEPNEFEYKMVCLLFALKEFFSLKDIGYHFDFSSMFMTKGPYPDPSSAQKKPLYEYIEPNQITQLLEILKGKYKCLDFGERLYFETVEELLGAIFEQKKLDEYADEAELISTAVKMSEQKKYPMILSEKLRERFNDVFEKLTIDEGFDTFTQHEDDVVCAFTASFSDDTGDFYVNNVFFHHCEMSSDSYTYLSKAFHTENGKVVDCHVSRQTIQRLFRDLGMTKAVWSLFFKRYNGKVGEKFQEKDRKKLFTFRRQVTLGEIRREKLDIKAARAEIAKKKKESTP